MNKEDFEKYIQPGIDQYEKDKLAKKGSGCGTIIVLICLFCWCYIKQCKDTHSNDKGATPIEEVSTSDYSPSTGSATNDEPNSVDEFSESQSVPSSEPISESTSLVPSEVSELVPAEVEEESSVSPTEQAAATDTLSNQDAQKLGRKARKKEKRLK